ncbi:MAG: hypothetical protein AB7H80_10710 [Candidatus Kapaibacterium sp.]
MSISLRPVAAPDESFLFELFGAIKERDLEHTKLTRPQRRHFIRSQYDARKKHYDKFFDDAEDSLILNEKKKIGRLILQRKEEEFRIIALEILPDYNGKGVYESIIQDIQAEAEEVGKPISVQVEQLGGWFDMLSALGFEKTGETEAHYQMEWNSERA